MLLDGQQVPGLGVGGLLRGGGKAQYVEARLSGAGGGGITGQTDTIVAPKEIHMLLVGVGPAQNGGLRTVATHHALCVREQGTPFWLRFRVCAHRARGEAGDVLGGGEFGVDQLGQVCREARVGWAQVQGLEVGGLEWWWTGVAPHSKEIRRGYLRLLELEPGAVHMFNGGQGVSHQECVVADFPDIEPGEDGKHGQREVPTAMNKPPVGADAMTVDVAFGGEVALEVRRGREPGAPEPCLEHEVRVGLWSAEVDIEQ